jgi:hypothetical protein
MNNNSVSKHPTYFLKGVELIKEYEQENKVPTENWVYPMGLSFGHPNDSSKYYAEIWGDGMDWTSNYWLLEARDCERPKASLIMIIDNFENKKVSFNRWILEELLNSVMYYRRELEFFKEYKESIYDGSTYSFLKKYDNVKKYCELELYCFEHASQPKIKFWFNSELLPERYRI